MKERKPGCCCLLQEGEVDRVSDQCPVHWPKIWKKLSPRAREQYLEQKAENAKPWR